MAAKKTTRKPATKLVKQKALKSLQLKNDDDLLKAATGGMAIRWSDSACD